MPADDAKGREEPTTRDGGPWWLEKLTAAQQGQARAELEAARRSGRFDEVRRLTEFWLVTAQDQDVPPPV